MYLKKFFGHLYTICKHKYWVFYFACKFGIPIRGLFHDLSKFHPIEFFESVRYYTGNKSPIVTCKKDKGYSLAWQHHKGHNPHHYEYWIDNLDNGGTPLVIPFKYCIEMICDWLAAGKTYHGKNFTYESELNWWYNKRKEVQHSMHPLIINYIEFVLFCLVNFKENVNSLQKLKAVYYAHVTNKLNKYE